LIAECYQIRTGATEWTYRSPPATMETEKRGVTMAETPLVWEDLARYKAEGRFLDGYPDDQRTFFAPRDNVHGLLVALLDSAQHSIVVNMFGYDDDELNKII